MIDEQHLRDLIEEQIKRHMEGCQKTTTLLDARLKQIEDQSDKQAEHVTRLSLVMFGDTKLNVAGLVMQMSQIRKLMYVVIGLMIVNLIETVPDFLPTLLQLLP